MEDHERFMLKNKSMASGYQLTGVQKEITDKVGDEIDKTKETSCFNCVKKNRCIEFKSKSSGGGAGSVSIGADTTFICSKYAPFSPNKKEKPLSGKQIKNMMKLAQRGRL